MSDGSPPCSCGLGLLISSRRCCRLCCRWSRRWEAHCGGGCMRSCCNITVAWPDSCLEKCCTSTSPLASSPYSPLTSAPHNTQLHTTGKEGKQTSNSFYTCCFCRRCCPFKKRRLGPSAPSYVTTANMSSVRR